MGSLPTGPEVPITDKMKMHECDTAGGRRFRALIVGAGDTGIQLASRLALGWCVTLVDPSRESLEEVERVASNVGAALRTVQGDGTSRLVLEEAGAASADLALVVASPDSVGLEACRVLRRDFPKVRLLALVRQRRNLDDFLALGVDALSDSEAEAAALMARVDRGNRIAQQVGLGEGEVMETEVMPASSAIGKPLKSFHPQRWLVAAVYRDRKLVVPHGETVLEQGDRLLLVGDPQILPSIATQLRTGLSEFPLHFGAGFGVPLLPGIEKCQPEICRLFEASEAQFVSFLAPGEEKGTLKEVGRVARGEPLPLMEHPELSWPDELGVDAEALDLGLAVLPPSRLPILKQVGFGETLLVRRMRRLRCPVLVPRSGAAYERVLLCVTGAVLDGEAATLALDVARRLQLPIVLVTTAPPSMITGPGHTEAMERAVQDFSDLATHYRMRFDRMVVAGNPVRGILASAKPQDLMVLGLSDSDRNSMTSPCVPMHLVHQAACSVMVLPHAEPGA